VTKTLKDLANPWVGKLPVYEPGKPIEEVARELGFEDESAISKLAANENALGPSPKALAAIHAAAEKMHLYPDGGAFRLRRALSSRLGVKPEQVLVTNGSNEAIVFLAGVFLGPGKGIVMADRAFVVYKLVALAAQSRTIQVPMRSFTHDLDAMLGAIKPETRIVFISNPNNPTSTMVSQDEIERFMDKVPDHVVVCFDEAYIELLEPDLQPDTIRYVREGRNVFVLRTFSKTYGLAGLRIGYAVAPEAGIALMNNIRQPFNVSAMALAAAEAALGDNAFVARTRGMVRDGIRYLEAGFKRLGLEYVPAVANFVLVRVGQGRKVFQALMKKGLIVRPMDVYGLPEYVRVTTGTVEENRRFMDALAEVVGCTTK